MAEQGRRSEQDVLAVCLTELWGEWLDEELSAALPTTDTPRSNPSKRRRRVTPKQQIAGLQDEVQALITRLRRLSERRPPSQLQSSHSQLWQQISERQLERRRVAEAENARLRDMLVLQTQEAKNLRRILKRRTRIHMLQDMLGQDRQQQRGQKQLQPARASTQGALDSMLRETELLRLQMDQLFLDKGVQSLPCPGQRRHVNSTTLNGVCFELARREALPFSVDMVEQAVWTALGLLELQGVRSAGKFTADVELQSQSSDGATAMLSFFAAQSKDRTAGVKVRKVVRRYEEGARTVFIYRTVMEPQLDTPGMRVGVYATSTLLVEVQRDVAESDSTLLQSHFSATRHDEGLEAGHRLRLPANLDAAIAVWDESITRIHRQVENTLLDATFNDHLAS